MEVHRVSYCLWCKSDALRAVRIEVPDGRAHGERSPPDLAEDASHEEIGRKRLHVHIAVEDLAASVRFYATLFAAEPTVLKPDYAKWMLQDPRMNFAISQRGATPGIEHLGIQVEDHSELEEVYARLKRAEQPVLEEGNTTCCYAQSEKSWISDPQGVLWEAFLTSDESTVYGHDANRAATPVKSAYCAPARAPSGANVRSDESAQ